MGLIETVVEISASIFVIALIFSLAMTVYSQANTSGWDDMTVLVWGYLGIIAIVGLALSLIFYAVAKKA